MEKVIKESDLISEELAIIHKEYATVYYSPDLKIVGVRWHGNFSQQQYIDLFNEMIDSMQGKPLIGFYSDIREQGVVPVGARKEFEKNFSPKGKAMGIDKTGVVTDASPFKKYYLNTIIKVTGRDVKLCKRPEEAIEYIIS